MRIAVTGGTGFVGGHLTRALSERGHDVVVLARGVDHRPWAQQVLELPGTRFVQVGTNDAWLTRAFEGCDAVADCAGINREIGPQTYKAVHVGGTANVVSVAQAAGVSRLAFVSFLLSMSRLRVALPRVEVGGGRTRPPSSRQWTVLKPGMMFGRGDHMLYHLSHALYTFPFFVGIGPPARYGRWRSNIS